MKKDGTLSIRNGHNPDVQASVLGHPTLNRKLLARSIVLECRGEGQGRGRRMGGGQSVSVVQCFCFITFVLYISLYIYIYIYICGCLCLFVSTLNPNG